MFRAMRSCSFNVPSRTRSEGKSKGSSSRPRQFTVRTFPHSVRFILDLDLSYFTTPRRRSQRRPIKVQHVTVTLNRLEYLESAFLLPAIYLPYTLAICPARLRYGIQPRLQQPVVIIVAHCYHRYTQTHNVPTDRIIQ